MFQRDEYSKNFVYIWIYIRMGTRIYIYIWPLMSPKHCSLLAGISREEWRSVLCFGRTVTWMKKPLYFAIGGSDTYCMCLPIVFFFVLFTYVLGKDWGSELGVRLRVSIGVWGGYLRFCARVVLPIFLVDAQEMRLVAVWRNWGDMAGNRIPWGGCFMTNSQNSRRQKIPKAKPR